MPSNRKIDVLGTSINSAFWAPIPGTEYGQQFWSVNNCGVTGSRSITYPAKNRAWSYGPSGYVLSINLPDHTAGNQCMDVVQTLGAYNYYTVDKLTNTNRIDAYGKYLHQEYYSQINPSITFAPLSFGISGSYSSRFTEATTHACINFSNPTRCIK